MENSNSLSRRRFVAGAAAAAAGGTLLGHTGWAELSRHAPTSIDALRQACKGTVTTAGEPGFQERVFGGLWNRLVPERAPQVIVAASDEQDVIAAIQFARENKLKVAVRGGGHNWCQPSLRNGGLLIDLKNLNQVISIDVAARKAVVQPIISNREIQTVLNAKGLAYPSGHCPQVKLSGYLLGGGMSWNQGVWGYGNESVEAIELVTAAGKLVTASEQEHADYFWAARGAGYGFFGVAIRYHLKLHLLPKAIHATSSYYLPSSPEQMFRLHSRMRPFRLAPRVYGGPWTMWQDAADGEPNTAWHQECVSLMKPYISGYYIGETDPVAVPSEATGAFSPESWKRLADLRDKYDPDGVFFGYFDGLA